ncbi:MAG: DTW domain-containing protein [Verrucomicrobiota bacterium]
MRKLVQNLAHRCSRCKLAPRWCVCSAHRDIAVPLEIDVLMHHRELFRPTSTGNLIDRAIPASRLHVYRRERRLGVADLQVPGREVWLLHPHGEPAPQPPPAADTIQAIFLDGSWREASSMAQEVAGWGRLISLPMSGESRYWLRAQADGTRFSTAEALLFLLKYLGLDEAHEALRLQFELHVYAGLRARGLKILGEEFLATSPIRTAFADTIAALNVSRPREAGGDGREVKAAEAEDTKSCP